VPTPTSFADALAHGVVALDGGLSTELEAAGHDVSTTLWSARLVEQDPAAVVAAHTRFFAAGARVATTASYQVSAQGFAAAGLGADAAERSLRRSVALAQDARDLADLAGRAWVAGSVGPYGAVLADGSEYTGAYAGPDGLDLDALRRFHRPRLTALADAGADVLACETLPAALEVEALLLELAELDVPAWVSLTTELDAAGTVRTRRGERAQEVFAMVRDAPSVVAAGVNCLAPGDVAPAARAAGASGLPVVVYPNSGERWDAEARSWAGDPRLSPADVERWVEGGARLVGGCCRVGPELLADLVRRLPPAPALSG
jgi:homocysteine S-methyltransferase